MTGALLSCCLISFMLSGPTLAHTETGPVYDQYSLQATAEGEVVNDLMVVQLQVEHEDRNTAVLADRVNRDMNWALEQLEAYENIESNTENYSTYPKYEQNRVIGWRSAQTLMIQGSDFDALKEALQKLQSKLQVKHMQFRPRDETRKLAEDTLMREALDNFKHRATIVQENMAAGSYRVMQISIDTGGSHGRRMAMDTRAMSMSKSVESAPAVEGGDSKITVRISGQIQLQ